MNQESDKQTKVEEAALIYTGSKDYQPDAEKQEKHRLYPYMPSKELREAVNLAIYLERPLLIKGEPGSGKTRLAYAVAHEFSQTYYKKMKEQWEEQRRQKIDAGEPPGDEPNPFEIEDDKGFPGWPFYFWPVKSTSRAQDGLYVYDAVGRLHNATLPAREREKKTVKDYIEYGPLGKAFQTKIMRPIVLIDEIDKADIDFPNDLLIELEDPKFKVKELKNKEISSDIQPIIFITSNAEKELPDAFLRRCIFFYINFPGREELKDIIRERLPDHNEALVVKAVEVFVQLRKNLVAKRGKTRKLPSTSELIDWVKALHRNTSTTEQDVPISEEAFRELGDEKAILE